jgi:hypothetical protein
MAYLELVDEEYAATQREERTPAPALPVEAIEEAPQTEAEAVEDAAVADAPAGEETAPDEGDQAAPDQPA